MNFDFQPMNFIYNLPVLAKGMLGIFTVILIIVIITMLLNKFTSPKK